MTDPTSEQKPAGFRRYGCLFPVIGFIMLLAVGYLSMRLTTPARLEKANACIGPAVEAPQFRNTCEHDINLQYCLYSKAGSERDMCRTTLLTPDQGVTTLERDLAELGGLFRVDVMACKAPYLPGQVEDWNTKRMKPACLAADESGVGPHISR